jgi:GT2 family glycosyltransferase
LSTTAPQTRHTVTAIIVAHDGARLLPGLVQALQAQIRPVERTVGVDTGSRDRSGAVLAELIGQDAVFGMNRSTGYGEAVNVALRHASRLHSGSTDPSLGRVEWMWLLHDDCEPAPDALEKLLKAAGRDRSVVVLGPKVLDGQDRRTLREVGVSIDRAGRRVTGIDPGEIDQGQHDHNRAVLAVGSAGMLVRRDVWERLGGFDPRLKLFRDDVDFCWRVQAAGLRVHVVPEAVLYHRELSARRRRPTEGGNARRLDRRNALYVLAVNLPLLAMLRVVGGCVVGSLVRAFYFLLTKQLDLAAAHAFAVGWLFGHPIRLLRARRRRAAGLAEGYSAVRVFIRPAHTPSRLAEKIAGLMSNGPPQASGGRHQATVDESEEDEQFVDTQSTARRVIGHPGVQLCTVLLVVALIAERRLLGTSPLGGGALVPAWGGAAALWQEYLAGFHAVGVGSTASAPPYLAVVAGLATVLGGQAWLAVDVLLLGCVPLAGLTAYLATRWLVTATPARVLLAASYALLPVATGAVAAGRLGTAVAFILLPPIAVSAGRMLTAAPRQARRAAWAAGLLIAVASAFAPLTWVLGVVFVLGALAARRWLIAVHPLNAVIVVAVPFFVLFPWSLHLLASPSAFLSEAGLSTPALTTQGLAPTALLALSPGGPGVPPIWVTIGFGLALLALALRPRRAGLVIAGWTVAIAGLLAAVLVSRIRVTPASGGQPADGWPGVALALAALGLLLAAAPTAQWLAGIIPNDGSKLSPPSPDQEAGYALSRRLLAGVALAAAATAPLLVAVYWVSGGVQGPVGSVAAPLLPAFVSASSTSGQQYRTLILRPDDSAIQDGGLDYMVVRQGDPSLGEPELTVAPAAEAALSREVAGLGAPDGADAGDPGLVLGTFGIRWVLLPGPVDPVLAQQLDAAVGLVALSKAPTYDLWQVTGPVARVRVVAADGTTTPLLSGAVNLSGVSAPAGGGTLVLAEPYGGWTAALNGRALKPLATPVDGWAQGFVLPPGGGQLSITRNNLARFVSLIGELIATLAVCLLALPGKRADPVEEAEALAALREARHGRRAASPGRRVPQAPRAQAPKVRAPRAGGTGHRAVSGADRLGLARKRRAGQELTVEAAKDAQLAEPVQPEAVPADAPVGVPANVPADVTAVLGAGVLGDEARGDGTHGGPWDMAGDWGGTDRESSAGAWTVDSGAAGAWTEDSGAGNAWAEDSGAAGAGTEDPWAAREWTEDSGAEDSGAAGARTEDPLVDGDQRDRTLQRAQQGGWNDPDPSTGPRPASSTTGQQPLVPETPAPWETGPQRAPWETGPQAPVSSTGAQRPVPWHTEPQFPPSSTAAQPRRPWESGPQAPVSPIGSQPAAPTGPQPVSSTGERRAASTGSQPRYPWESDPQAPVSPVGSQLAAPTGSESVSSTGSQPRYPWETGPSAPVPAAGPQPRYPWESGPQAPVSPTGSQPVDMAPWEYADWNRSRDPDAAPDRGDAVPAQTESASAPSPVAARPAKPERHSHRAAKHGRPSRWRGSGNRSDGDGKS